MCVSLDGEQSVGIILFPRHVQQIAGVLQAAVDGRQRIDDRFEGFFFFAEVLGALRIVPDGGVFEFGVNLFEFL